MIKVKTIFVLGAGAHCPYGFPDGGSLVMKMITALPRRPDESSSFTGFYAELRSFLDAKAARGMASLRRSLDLGGHASIDSFLRTHKANELYVHLGKLLVAYLLMPIEFGTDFGRSSRRAGEDWMTYLFSKMLEDCRDSPEQFVSQNAVGFVTFNYDRTLEYFLTLKLQHTFELDASTAWNYASQFPIHHVYGSLGAFNPRATAQQKAHASLVETASKGIKLMYEDRQQSEEISQIKKLLASARRVGFLGFSFDSDNIQVLDLPRVCYEGPDGTVKLSLASRFNVADGEWDRIKSAMSPAPIDDVNRVTHRNWDALQFLRESRLLA